MTEVMCVPVMRSVSAADDQETGPVQGWGLLSQLPPSIPIIFPVFHNFRNTGQVSSVNNVVGSTNLRGTFFSKVTVNFKFMNNNICFNLPGRPKNIFRRQFKNNLPSEVAHQLCFLEILHWNGRHIRQILPVTSWLQWTWSCLLEDLLNSCGGNHG